MKSLSRNQRGQWRDDGYLVLSGFFSDGDLAAVEDEVERYWNDRSTSNPLVVDVIDGELNGRRMHMRDLDPIHRHTPHKLNDLYLESEACRRLVLDERLVAILRALIDDEPVAINSLSFAKGSQQEPHFDTYFMPPPVENRLVVTSIYFEDAHPDAGPLVYYPGSHRIEPFRFPDGGLAALDQDLGPATDHIRSRLTDAGLRERTFLGARGDVFIWHGQLFHGGAPIVDHERTRRSLVTHYWGEEDMGGEIRTCSTGGKWFARSHPPVPAGEAPTS